MVVRIRAASLATASRLATCRSPSASAIVLLRRDFASQNYNNSRFQPENQAQQTHPTSQYPPPPPYTNQPGSGPLPQYFPPQPPPPPKKRLVYRSTYVFLAFGALVSFTAAATFREVRVSDDKFKNPRGSAIELAFKVQLAREAAERIPLLRVLQSGAEWEEWDVGKQWKEIEDKENEEREKGPVAEQATQDLPGGELVDAADVAEELAATGRASTTLDTLVNPPTPQHKRLTTGALGSVDGIGGYHRVFHNHTTGEIVSIMYIGGDMAGFPGTTHGGALATIIDEALGRCAIMALPARTGVTAHLELNYRNPAPTHRFYVVWCTPQFPDASKLKPGEELRKLWCKATLSGIDGTGCVEARGLFVVPRKYKLGRVEEKF